MQIDIWGGCCRDGESGGGGGGGDPGEFTAQFSLVAVDGRNLVGGVGGQYPLIVYEGAVKRLWWPGGMGNEAGDFFGTGRVTDLDATATFPGPSNVTLFPELPVWDYTFEGVAFYQDGYVWAITSPGGVGTKVLARIDPVTKAVVEFAADPFDGLMADANGEIWIFNGGPGGWGGWGGNEYFSYKKLDTSNPTVPSVEISLTEPSNNLVCFFGGPDAPVLMEMKQGGVYDGGEVKMKLVQQDGSTQEIFLPVTSDVPDPGGTYSFAARAMCYDSDRDVVWVYMPGTRTLYEISRTGEVLQTSFLNSPPISFPPYPELGREFCSNFVYDSARKRIWVYMVHHDPESTAPSGDTSNLVGISTETAQVVEYIAVDIPKLDTVYHSVGTTLLLDNGVLYATGALVNLAVPEEEFHEQVIFRATLTPVA